MELFFQISFGILIPFVGTALGGAAVFFLRGALLPEWKKAFFGISAGVMLAACIWSLLIPSIELEGGPVSALLGLFCGVGFFLLCDLLLAGKQKQDALPTDKGKTLALAVTLHNIPEGMAVGVALAGALSAPEAFSMTPALVLAVGIAIQNFPEGAIISLPLAGLGTKKGKAFLYGAASGVVEPLGAILALLLTHIVLPVLPFILSFSAGAMLYVVVVELIPEFSVGKGGGIGCIFFTLGFALMMTLDVLLG